MNAWPLGAAQSSDYQYSVNAGLERTSFATAHPRQKRKIITNTHTFSASFILTQSELVAAKAFLQAYGFSWFTMPLLNGSTSTPVTDLIVRATSDDKVDALGYDTYRLSLQVESRAAEALSLPGVVYGSVLPVTFHAQDGCASCSGVTHFTVKNMKVAWSDIKTMDLPGSQVSEYIENPGGDFDETRKSWSEIWWGVLQNMYLRVESSAAQPFDVDVYTPFYFAAVYVASRTRSHLTAGESAKLNVIQAPLINAAITYDINIHETPDPPWAGIITDYTFNGVSFPYNQAISTNLVDSENGIYRVTFLGFYRDLETKLEPGELVIPGSTIYLVARYEVV